MQKLMNDPTNPKFEWEKIENGDVPQKVEQVKPKTPVQRKVDENLLVKFKNQSQRQKDQKNNILNNQKAHIMNEMMKKMDGQLQIPASFRPYYFGNLSVIKSSLKEWIIEKPKPKDSVVPNFNPYYGKTDYVNYIFYFQQKMALEIKK